MSGPTPNPLVHKYKNKKTHKVKLTLKKKKKNLITKPKNCAFLGPPIHQTKNWLEVWVDVDGGLSQVCLPLLPACNVQSNLRDCDTNFCFSFSFLLSVKLSFTKLSTLWFWRKNRKKKIALQKLTALIWLSPTVTSLQNFLRMSFYLRVLLSFALTFPSINNSWLCFSFY